MPNPIETDPKKGFVALPASIFDIDLTPGAFRTLAELCRMANLDGQCWPSLKQLGERLGRSRAAVSGYIAELREAALLETETQTMANGYNYRLRYTVTFWKSWRAQLGKSNERSVKPAERPLRTKNQNHKNNSPAGELIKTDLVSRWAATVGKASYPEFQTWPSQALLEETKKRASIVTEQQISVDIGALFKRLLTKKGVDFESEACAASLSFLRQRKLPSSQAKALIKSLDDLWKPHWSNPPTPFQLEKVLRSLPPDQSEGAQVKLLKSYLRRWEIHLQRLPSDATSARVAA